MYPRHIRFVSPSKFFSYVSKVQVVTAKRRRWELINQFLQSFIRKIVKADESEAFYVHAGLRINIAFTSRQAVRI